MEPMEPKDGFIERAGIRFHYADWGGNGPPAALFHANGFHARLWDPVARALARHFRVVAFDHRGHGDSDKPRSGYEWSIFVDDVIRLLDGLALREVVAVGHSFGGTAVSGAAARRPDLFDRIVLVDPVFFPRELRGEDVENPMVMAALKRQDAWPDRDTAIESYRGRGPFASWTEESLRLYVEHGTREDPDGTVRLKCPREVEAAIFGMASHYDAWSTLQHITVPTLLIVGERSNVFTRTDAEEALSRLRRGRLREASGATHFVPMEVPDRVAREIEDFCQKEGDR